MTTLGKILTLIPGAGLTLLGVFILIGCIVKKVPAGDAAWGGMIFALIAGPLWMLTTPSAWCWDD